jgi:aldose 1-epimerase
MKNLKTITLRNQNNFQVNILNYGAIIQSFLTPDGDNLVLNYASPEEYLINPCFLGCVIGPVANRIKNAAFSIGDNDYKLDANENNQHCLHSGCDGLHQVFWDVVSIHENQVELHYVSNKKSSHFPGKVSFTIIYQLTDKNELRINYQATTDTPTIVDLTNHTYWTLDPQDNILDYNVRFTAQEKLLSKNNIPTGKTASVAETAFDFNAAKLISQDINMLTDTRGYDHYFILPEQHKLQLAAIITNSASKRQLTVHTTSPGFQFYSGNYLHGNHEPYSGLCIETQGFPNAINHSNFPSPVLYPGETYQQTTIYGVELL